MSDSNVMQPMPHTQSGAGVYNEKLGMWVFLGSEVMFFTALIGAYIILRVGNPGAWPEGGPKELLNIPITAANTFLLICSSVAMVKAFASIAAGNQRGLVAWLWTTVVMGAAFVAVQVFEYRQLLHHEFTPSEGLFGSTFFSMTGFHGFHVSMGVICMAWVALKAMRGGYTQEDYRGVEVIGLYWHFVDLVWIILFTIVYLI